MLLIFVYKYNIFQCLQKMKMMFKRKMIHKQFASWGFPILLEERYIFIKKNGLLIARKKTYIIILMVEEP